jgi:hypothetical protein
MMQSVESHALAKVDAKPNNAHVRRIMSSALQNVTKMVHVAKIKVTNYVHLYSFYCLIFSYSIFDIEYNIVCVHSDIGLGRSDIRRTFLLI